MSFTDDITIDKFSLDIEWMRQAELVHKYGTKYAESVDRRDTLKDQLDEIKDDLFVDIKTDWSSYELDKSPTDSMTKAIVNIDEEVKVKKAEHKHACLSANVYLSAVKALDHKKHGLEYLSKLLLTGYWADPKISVKAKDTYGEFQTQETTKKLQNESGTKRLKRRKKNGKEKESK